jgi:hypothetical protein
MIPQFHSQYHFAKQYMEVIPSAVETFIKHLSIATVVPERELLTNALLYLPRLANAEGYVTLDIAAEEIRRLESILAKRIAQYKSWLKHPSSALKLTKAALRPLPETDARMVLNNFHYLNSCRAYSNHYALTIDNESTPPAVVVTVSPFDLNHLVRYIPPDIAPAAVRVLSRVYAFPWAPANSISFTLSRLCRRLASSSEDQTEMLLTYVNPNLGYTATSYEASNWVFFAREVGTHYSYVDGLYMTDRKLHSAYGTADPSVLEQKLGNRIQFSKMPLEPLQLYAYFLGKNKRKQYNTAFDITVERPT